MQQDLESMMSGFSQDHLHTVDQGNKDASGEGRAGKLTISGKYVMQASTVAYFNKKNEPVFYPDKFLAQDTGTLMLSVRLDVLDPTDSVKKGEYAFVNIPIVAGPKHDKESDEDYKKRVAGTQSICKQYLAALLGTTDIKVPDIAWMKENILAEFAMEGAKIKVVRDHKMKNPVLVVCEDDRYQNRDTIKVKSIVAARAGDKSVSNSIPAPASNVDVAAAASKVNLDATSVTQEDVEQAGAAFNTSFPGAPAAGSVSI